ncbi:hypothetical protein ACO1O0_002308 [Amphichorda felina]
MKLNGLSLGAAAMLTMSAVAPWAAAYPQPRNTQARNFTYDDKSFLLDGEALQLLGGEMEPQRVPKQYWRHRMQMAKALGLNTIFSYIFWNNIEPTPGQFNFEDRNDIATFFRIAQEEGLYVVLRPGPYICGEHEWGGFPAWLTEIDGMEVRSNNKPFLDASRNFLNRLGTELQDLQVTKGGPILLVQLENEYGSFDSDKEYLQGLADILRDNFEVPLYTNDGPGADYLAGGTLHGVLAAIDGDTKTGFEARNNLTDETMLGPLLNGEYYTQWFDSWTSDTGHTAPTSEQIATHIDELKWILDNGHHFNLFMFHGGTNFGFEAGSVSTTKPVTTSYDYGAPLDETGRPTELYWKIRELIVSHVGADNVPAVPESPSIAEVPEFALEPALALFDTKPSEPSSESDSPVTMESLGQAYGYVLYEHTATEDASGALAPGDKARDRVIIYVNGNKVGVIDVRYENPAAVNVDLKKGDSLQLLVENLGRVDFTKTLLEQDKGIVGDVTVGGSAALKGWSAYSLPLDKLPEFSGGDKPTVEDAPVFYTGSFKLPEGAKADRTGDVLLTIPNGVKGQLFVNGVNLGRSWKVGPQQELYVPGCYVKDGGADNEVVYLELEPSADTKLAAKGVAAREWANHPDPDRTE